MIAPASEADYARSAALLLFMARCAELSHSFVEIVALMGCAGVGCAIGVHFAVGYLDFWHLLPAFVGFMIFVLADGLLWIGRKQRFLHPGHPEHANCAEAKERA